MPQPLLKEELVPPKGPELRLHHTVQDATAEVRPATFGARAAASFIDGLVFGSVQKVFVLLLHGLSAYLTEHNPLLGSLLGMAVYLALMTICFAFPLAEWGCTLGKKLVGIRVIRSDTGKNLTIPQALNRETFGKILSLISVVGFFLALGKDGLALHDKICTTRVVR